MTEQQTSRNDLIAVGTTNVVLLPTVTSGMKRVSFTITNTSPGAQVITVVKSNIAAVAGFGDPLQVNERAWEATSEGFECWQGQINVVSNLAAGQVSVTERQEPLSGVKY